MNPLFLTDRKKNDKTPNTSRPSSPRTSLETPNMLRANSLIIPDDHFRKNAQTNTFMHEFPAQQLNRDYQFEYPDEDKN